MAYVPVPKDLTRVKTKFLFNLTKRQVICFGMGALVGVPLFFLTKNVLGASMATLLMIHKRFLQLLHLYAVEEARNRRVRIASDFHEEPAGADSENHPLGQPVRDCQ